MGAAAAISARISMGAAVAMSARIGLL